MDQAHSDATTQEDLMEIVMDPQIANFNLISEANKLREREFARKQAALLPK